MLLKAICRVFITSLVKRIYKTTLREKHNVLPCIIIIIIIIDITITATIVIILTIAVVYFSRLLKMHRSVCCQLFGGASCAK